MFKKVTVVMFVIALAAFTFIPQNEARIDVVSSSIKEASAQAETTTGSVSTFSYGADGKAMTLENTLATPVPTSKSTSAPTPKSTPAPTPTPLYSGTSNSDVTKMQQRLIELGFLSGTADGVYGSGTDAAVINVKNFLNDQYRKSVPAPTATVDADGNTVIPDDSASLPYDTSGNADYKFLQALYNTDFSQYLSTLKTGDTGAAVKRMQTRLIQLAYLYKGADGAYGATTAEAITLFQTENGLPQSGIADANTLSVLFSQDAAPNSRPLWEYNVKVDLSEQRVYVYKWSTKDNAYTNLVKKFKCSTGASGTPTPKGVYQETVRRGADWHHFKDFGNCWARYAIHIDPTGNIMFHSVLYTRKGGSPTSSSVRALGRRASHGCIRLAVADAKWMYESITDGTTVTIQK